MARFDLFTFAWASVLTRGARFFAEATVLKFYGPAILVEVEKRLTTYVVVGVALVIGVVVLVKVLG